MTFQRFLLTRCPHIKLILSRFFVTAVVTPIFLLIDNLCIISGKKLLFINPHEKVPDKVCITIDLAKIKRCKKMRSEELLETFNGKFGFSEDTFSTGHYEGTIFWFPLREAVSNLSDTIYDARKVLDLFTSFKTEAVSCLLFLKSLCRVEVYCNASNTEYDLPEGQAVFSVQVKDNQNDTKAERMLFMEKLRDCGGKIPSSSIVCLTKPTFKTKSAPDGVEEETSWLVVNMYKGGSMSDTLKRLTNDADLSYSPYVGVAVRLNGDVKNFRGHLFCFLPLPQEKKSLTGLPVHLNGFFALSQNRRHLKWASADQESFEMHRDKAIEWNECLMKEVLPEVYAVLITELVESCKEEDNLLQLVETVYRCIPDVRMVDNKWEPLVKTLHRFLLQQKWIFVENLQTWCEPYDPVYTLFDKQTVSETTKKCVRRVLDTFKRVTTTNIPVHVWEFLKRFSPSRQNYPRDIHPDIISEVLKREDNYEALSPDDRLNLLEYIVQNGKASFLKDLKLLPLENKSFTSFHAKGCSGQAVYICSKDEVGLFPGLEYRLLLTEIPGSVKDFLFSVASSGEIMSNLTILIFL